MEVQEHVVLFNKLGEPTSTRQLEPKLPNLATKLTEEEERIAGGIGFTWLMLSVASKNLARYPDSDMALMRYPKPGFEEAAALLGQANVAASAEWSTPDRPAGKVVLLRNLAEKTEQLTCAANEKGMSLSKRPAACVGRYLDMIEGILNGRL